MGLTVRLLTLLAEHQRIEADMSRCIRQRRKDNSCTRCLDVCPSPSAVELTVNPVFHSAHCLECMQCINVCPTQVFRDKKGKQQLQSFENRKTVTIACERYGNKVHHVTVPCLRQLELFHLLTAAQYTDSINVYMNLETCNGCPLYKENLHQLIKTVIDTAEEWFANVGERKAFSVLKEWTPGKEEQQVFSRREFFQVFARQTPTNTLGILLPPFPEEKTFRDKHPLSEEKKLLQYLLSKHVHDLKANVKLPGKHLKSTRLKISDSCNLCGQCVIFCPTGSLELKETDEQGTLMQSVMKCVDCGLCKEVCLQNAVEFEGEVSVLDFCSDTPIPLLVKNSYRCEQCGEAVYSNSICPDCEAKRRIEDEIDGFFF